MSQKLPHRTEVPTAETWDLSDLYADSAAYEKAIHALYQDAQGFKAQYEGQLNQLDTIKKGLEAFSQILIELDRAGNYAELLLSVDTTDAERQRLSALFSTNYGKILSQLSFVESELLSLDKETMDTAINELPYGYYLKQLQKDNRINYMPKQKKLWRVWHPRFHQQVKSMASQKCLILISEVSK